MKRRNNKSNMMQMIAVILIFAVTLAFTGCSSKTNVEVQETSTEQQEQEILSTQEERTTEIIVSQLKEEDEELEKQQEESKKEEVQAEKAENATKNVTKKVQQNNVRQQKAVTTVATKVEEPQQKEQAKPYMSFYPTNSIRYGETVSLTIGNADKLAGNSIFESTNEDVAVIDQGGNIKVRKAGQTVIKVTFTGDDKNLSTTAEAVLTIEKGIPFYLVPTDLKAELGQKLEEIELPEGFSWENPEKQVGIVDVKGDEPTLMYTPEDTENYEIIKGIKVELKVTSKKTSSSSSSSGSSSGGNTKLPEEENPPINKEPDIGTENNDPNKSDSTDNKNNGSGSNPGFTEGDQNESGSGGTNMGTENNNDPNESDSTDNENKGSGSIPGFSEGDSKNFNMGTEKVESGLNFSEGNMGGSGGGPNFTEGHSE